MLLTLVSSLPYAVGRGIFRAFPTRRRGKAVYAHHAAFISAARNLAHGDWVHTVLSTAPWSTGGASQSRPPASSVLGQVP